MAAAPKPASLTDLGRDLLVTPFYAATNWGTLDLTTNPPEPPRQLAGPVDLAIAAAGDCLRQALILRLLTPVGSLADLGHARFGSRLHQLVGTPHTAASRHLARSFVLQAVAEEPRVERVLAIEVLHPLPGEADQVRIRLTVQPVGGGDPVALGLEVGG
jgi:phage baseplate assembly protein W